MPFNPDVRDVHVDKLMTNLSVAYIMSERLYVASQIAPMVPVEKQSDIIPWYTKADWFRDEAELRSPMAESAGSDFGVDNTHTYYCNTYAFHKDIPDRVRDNQDSPYDVDDAARMYVTQKLLLKKDVLCAATIFVTGVWGTSVDFAVAPYVQWSDYGLSNPITDIEVAREAIFSVTAFDPQTALIGRAVWAQLKHHPAFLERIKYTERGIITKDLIASVLDIENLVIGQSIRNTAVEGATAAYAYNFGKNFLLMYVNPRPSLLTPSAMYSFIWKNNGRYATFRRLRNEWKQFERVEGEFNVDFRIVATDLGYFGGNVVA